MSSPAANAFIMAVKRPRTKALAAGELTDQQLTLDSVLSLVLRRAGRKHVILYVDEILKIDDNNVINNLMLNLAAAQDDGMKYKLRAYFSALKVDIFASAQSRSGRAIISTPLSVSQICMIRGKMWNRMLGTLVALICTSS